MQRQLGKKRTPLAEIRDDEKVASIVRDAGGKIVGRTRLQKVSYLLELTGLGFGFNFEYRHYGPYSEELTSAIHQAQLSGLIQEEEFPTSWGGFYSVYKLLQSAGGRSPRVRSDLIKEAINADPIELELAATAAFLFTNGTDDPWNETSKRKPEKATDDRLKGAKRLYKRLSKVEAPRPLPKIA